ncbi:tetratricopeptide repeat protein [Thalassotalea fusca]
MKGLSIALLALTMSSSALANISDISVALDNKNIDQAKVLFDNLTEQNRHSLDGQIAHARILMATNEYEDANDALEELAQAHKDNPTVQFYYGLSAMKMAQIASIFSKLGYAEDGLKALEQTIALDPKHEKALDVLIGFHLAAPGIAGGDKDAALKYAHQLKALDQKLGYIQIARVQQGLEQPEESIKTLTEGISKYPEHDELYFNRAIMYIGNNAWQEAHGDLSKAIALTQDEQRKASAMYQLGKVAAESGNFLTDGEQMLTPLLTSEHYQYPNWVKFRLAQVYFHQNALDKAKAIVNEVDWGEDSNLKKRVKKFKKTLKANS